MVLEQPGPQLAALVGLLETIVDPVAAALRNAPIDDEPVTEDEERAVSEAEACAVVESVKAASDVYAPLAGKVVEINETIVEDPSIVNSDAEGEGWFFRLELDDPESFEALMDQDAYDEYLETL